MTVKRQAILICLYIESFDLDYYLLKHNKTNWIIMTYLSKLLLILLSVCILTGCQPNINEELAQAKSLDDINLQQIMLKKMQKDSHNNKAVNDKITLVNTIINLNTKAQAAFDVDDSKSAFLFACEANEKQSNKQSRQLIKKAGKNLLSEILITDVLSHWFDNKAITVTKSEVYLPVWQTLNDFNKPLPNNSLLTLLTASSNEVATTRYLDVESIRKILIALNHRKNTELYTAFKNVQNMINVLYLDHASLSINKGFSALYIAHKNLLSFVSSSGRAATGGGAWENDFIDRSDQYKIEIGEQFLKPMSTFIAHIYYSNTSEFEQLIRQSIVGFPKDMHNILWPTQGLQAYLEGEESRSLQIQNKLQTIEKHSKKIDRKTIIKNYRKAIDFLNTHYIDNHPLQAPLLQYRKLIRGY
jgi:hypothetical protein